MCKLIKHFFIKSTVLVHDNMAIENEIVHIV